jgi:NTE family protein
MNSPLATSSLLLIRWLLVLVIACSSIPSAQAEGTSGQKLPSADRLTARLDRPKIGLVLSGGGACGSAHVGTLKMLDSLQIPIDFIAGTSMGGLVGALYALGYSGQAIEDLLRDIDWYALFDDAPPRRYKPFPAREQDGRWQLTLGLARFSPHFPSGLIYGQNLSLLFSDLAFPFCEQLDFDSLPTPFRCVAIDLISGRRVVLKEGSLPKAMQATMAIPTIFSPVAWGDSLLVDGGSADNLPVTVVREMGADLVIAVDVASLRPSAQQLNSALTVLEQWLAIGDTDRREENLSQSDILIQPDLDGYYFASFSREEISGIIERGNEAARAAASQVRELTGPWRDQFRHHGGKRRLPTLSGLKKGETAIPGNARAAIEEIYVTGNQYYTESFIRNRFAMLPGDPLDREAINHGIRNLYGLGYFETVRYELTHLPTGGFGLQIVVKELPRRKLLLGLHYDNYHQLVGAVGFQAVNAILSGMRIDGELQFAGFTSAHLKAFYPSPGQDLPLYPYLSAAYRDKGVNLFLDDWERAAQYNDRAFSAEIGAGLMLGKALSAECGVRVEAIRAESQFACPCDSRTDDWKHELRQLALRIKFDNLDDPLFPKAGAKADVALEKATEQLDSDIPYERVSVEMTLHHTFSGSHTVSTRLWHGDGDDRLPAYKHHRIGGGSSFAGLEYDQLLARKMTTGRLGYKFRLHSRLFLVGVCDYGRCHLPLLNDLSGTVRDVWGFGAGMVARTPIGPAELMWGYSDLKDDNRGLVGYFSFGCRL